MKGPLLKLATEVPIIETRSFVQDGVQQSSEVREIALEAVIDEFLFKC